MATPTPERTYPRSAPSVRHLTHSLGRPYRTEHKGDTVLLAGRGTKSLCRCRAVAASSSFSAFHPRHGPQSSADGCSVHGPFTGAPIEQWDSWVRNPRGHNPGRFTFSGRLGSTQPNSGGGRRSRLFFLRCEKFCTPSNARGYNPFTLRDLRLPNAAFDVHHRYHRSRGRGVCPKSGIVDCEGDRSLTHLQRV